jgi:MoaA/NifB/PqqE/SkfB family radical SAM enzyme
MIDIEKKTALHPCYSGGCENGRIHLPVAPACNIQCNYCNRKFDCVNESRPGVTSEVLTPEQALERYKRVKRALPNIRVAGIAGPGDALANFDKTHKTFELIKEYDPDVIFCLSTNGLYLERYAERLVQTGVTHITVTLNTINPETGAKIYKSVNYGGAEYTGVEGAELLLEKQISGLKKLRESNVVTKVNTVLIKGVNDKDIENVAKTANKYGVYIGNVMQLIPAPDSAFCNMPLTSNAELNEVREKCGAYLKQMYHCRQCRADAIGALEEDCSARFCNKSGSGAGTAKGKFTALVTSSDRRLVNQHFGHADKFYIYHYNDGLIRLAEIRETAKYCDGIENCGDDKPKFNQLSKAAKDCDVIITMRIGDGPRKLFESMGKTVITTYGYINGAIQEAAAKKLSQANMKSAPA